MRLIDADALIPMMKYATTDSEIGVFPIKIGFNDIEKVINEQPTVDTVKHWQEETDMKTDFYTIPMSYEEAISVIKNSNENTEEQVMCSAIHKIMSMETINAVTKDVLKKAVKYLFDKRYVYLVKRD